MPTRGQRACPSPEVKRKEQAREKRRPNRVAQVNGRAREAATTACCCRGVAACIAGQQAVVTLHRGRVLDLATAAQKHVVPNGEVRREIRGLP